MTRKDVNGMLECVCEDAEMYFSLRNGWGPQAPAPFRGRGAKPQIAHRTVTAPHTDEAGATLDLRSHRMYKLARRCEELVRKLHLRDAMSPVPQEWHNMWNKCRKDGAQLLPNWDIWLHGDLPDLALLRHLSKAVREAAQENATTRRRDRRKAWEIWFREDWQATRKNTFEFVRDGESGNQDGLPILQRPDSSLTGDIHEMHSILTEAWEPTFRMYACQPPPSWEDFCAEFEEFFPHLTEYPFEEISLEDVTSTLKKMGNTSCGSDGFRVAEIKALPPEILERIVILFNMIEQLGEWPEALTLGVISMIPKGEGLMAQDLRPITVMPALYRLWSAVRVSSVLRWQEGWATPCLLGFRHMLGCEDVFWQMALDIEKALLCNERLCGLSVDFSKAFDRVPQEHVFKLASRLGLPHHIIGALKAMYAQLRRRFKIGGTVGEAFASTNGILQGCPLSIVLLNILMQVWCNAAEALGAQPKCYADDASASCGNPGQVREVLRMTQRFALLTGMKLICPKSLVWALRKNDRRNLKRGFKHLSKENKPQISLGERLLGAQMQYSGKYPGKRSLTKRLGEAEDACCRIEAVPLGMYDRGQLVESVVCPKVLYDACISPLSKTALNKWRTRTSRAIWGRGSRFKRNEMVFSLLSRGHATDPLQASAARIIKAAKRMTMRYPHRCAILQECAPTSLGARGDGLDNGREFLG